MRFLADESCDFRVVVALRAAHHDVAAVAEDSPGISDRQVIERARNEDRILLTEDRDFGQLVYADRLGDGAGVILVRCPEAARSRLPASLLAVVARVGAGLSGHFSVWTPERLRRRRSPREL